MFELEEGDLAIIIFSEVSEVDTLFELEGGDLAVTKVVGEQTWILFDSRRWSLYECLYHELRNFNCCSMLRCNKGLDNGKIQYTIQYVKTRRGDMICFK